MVASVFVDYLRGVGQYSENNVISYILVLVCKYKKYQYSLRITFGAERGLVTKTGELASF